MTRRLALESCEPRLLLDGAPNEECDQVCTIGGNEGGTGQGTGSTAIEGMMPAFQLSDANANSSRYQQAVSPRDYLQQVSGWYFAHAT